MTADLATRAKSALLAEELDKASLALEEHRKTASDREYLALEEIQQAAEIAYEDHNHPILLNNEGEPFKCPMCKCQLLESDMEGDDE